MPRHRRDLREPRLRDRTFEMLRILRAGRRWKLQDPSGRGPDN